MFKDVNFYIFGGSRDSKKNIWSQNGSLISPIEKSNLSYGRFIETTYVNNIPYILLSGRNHCECFNYEANNLKTYKDCKTSKTEHDIVNLFNKNNKIHLLDADSNGFIGIYDFLSTELIHIIEPVGNKLPLKALCSFNTNYLIAGGEDKKIKIIDMNKYFVLKEYTGHSENIYGIEKIKIDNIEELITYDCNYIRIWKN